MANQWDNVTLHEFTRIRAILNDSEATAEDKMISLAAVMQGVEESDILNMPLEKVQPVFALVHKLNEAPKAGKVRTHYQVGRWSLKVTGGELSVAQWIDFQNYMRAGVEEHLADIMSVVLVPVGKTYNEGYDIGALKSDLDNTMAVTDGLAVCFFFQRKWLKSMRRTLTYLAGWTTLKRMPSLRRKALELRREISGMLASL